MELKREFEMDSVHIYVRENTQLFTIFFEQVRLKQMKQWIVISMGFAIYKQV